MVTSALARSTPDHLMDGIGVDHFVHIIDHYLVPALDPQLQLVVLAVMSIYRLRQLTASLHELGLDFIIDIVNNVLIPGILLVLELWREIN